ncbi:MAG: NYN domain-containing protein [Verrucomicrobiales bacterium]|nr:NYN domain-containing protein [Verrucomicrobiales bacterium]
MSDSHPSFLLVDGNNIIHAWPDLLSIFRRRKESARNELIKLLEAYQDFSHDRVVVVFDGRGLKRSEQRDPGGIQVIFSSGDSSADSIIERLAAGNAQKYRIVVATNDIPVQDAVVASGGEAISSDSLADRIEQGEKEMHRWLENRRRS